MCLCRLRRLPANYAFTGLLTLSALSSIGYAQVAPDTLAKYDTNHNGKLDPAELSAMQADQSAATSAAAVPTETTVNLNPFQVSAERDNGYYASTTMSGTRIASKVEDLGASITVVTKQQLDDTAALDINDIFKYEVGTEGTADFTASNSAAPTTDSVQSSPATSTRVRGFSAPNTAVDNFPSVSRIPLDTYVIDSVEISRGPSSTLFGIGSPSGTVNINKGQADLSREMTSLTLRGDSYGGYRSSVSVNRPIIRDKLAIRVAALYMQNAYEQKPSYDLTKRLYGAFTAKPFKSTTIRGSYENFHEQRQTPNALTPRDGVSEWLQNGRPTWNPLNFTATVNGVQTAPIPVGSGATAENLVLPAGLFSNATTYTRPSMFIDGGQVRLWEVTRLNTAANPNTGSTSNVRMIGSGSGVMRATVNGGILYQVPGISNSGLYDWTSLNAVPTNWNKDRAHIYTFVVEQKITENLFARGGWHLEDFDTFNRNITNPPTLQIDVNQNLVDGRANPYFLRPYIQTIEPTIFRNPEYSDTLQGQLVYRLDFAKHQGITHWLGTHTIQGYYESRRIKTGTYRYREAITDPNHVWNIPGALNYTNGPAIGRPTYRYYVGGAGAVGYQQGFSPPKSGVSGTFNLNYVDPATGTLISEPAQFGTAPYVSGQTKQEDTARGGVIQSSFWNNRIVFTGGIRKDFNRTRNSNGAIIDGNSGFYTFANDELWGPWTSASGLTRDVNLVVRPLPNSRLLGLSYHRSSSFQPQPPAVDLNGNVLPNTTGHGQDVGAYINLMGDKLVLSVKVYKNQQVNDRNANTTIGSRIYNIEAGTGGGNSFSLQQFANSVATQRLGAGATPDQIAAEAAKITQFTPGFQKAYQAVNSSGTALRGTNDVEFKGTEVELTYSPNYNWNIKLAGGRAQTINTSLEGDLTDYLAARLPYWLSVKDDAGNLWWTSTALGAQSAQNFYSSAVDAQLKVDQALLGKPQPQNREYTARGVSTYRFTTGLLKNGFVGGAARWASRAVIGYRGSNPDTDGIVRSLDITRPVYDRARTSADFWIGYSRKIFADRVLAKIQLNVADAFEGGRLQPTAVNPNGQVYNYRIVNPRKFVLSTTFDF